MPLTAQTRQKSCVPCAKSKRKCDQGTPICSRCAEKFLFCQYKSEAAKSNDGLAGDIDMVMTYIPEPQNLQNHHGPYANETLEAPLGQNGFDVNISNGVQASDPWSFDDYFFGAYDDLIQTDSPEVIGTMDRERIRYCVRHLKSYPEKLFRFAKSPFIHLRVYSSTLPFPLQEACCAAALYAGKTEANEDMVWDIIVAKANQLTEPRGSWSVAEHLACVQALIIFQIIRLFDGDIRQRSEAEVHDEILVLWTNQLSSRTGVATGVGAVVPTSWESWVFQESVLRTIIVSLMVQAMFAIQKKGFCTLVAAVTDLSFTAQKTLWDAPSAQHWQRDFKDRRALYCPRMDFAEVMSNATPDDVDELTILMLVTYKGVDGVNEWIAKTGSVALIE